MTLKPRRALAVCCSVEVVKGGRVWSLFSVLTKELTVKGSSPSSFAADSASALLPSFTVFPSFMASFRGTLPSPALPFAVISQYSSGTNAPISRSRSTMSSTATDWTRPAERPRPTFFQRSGETM